MSGNRRAITVILSISALLNVIFVPIFDVWGGLFPSNPDRNFFDVIKIVFTDYDDWSLWVVHITMSILIPVIFMLTASLVNNKKLFLFSSLLGLILEGKQLIEYAIENELYEMLDYDDGNISIGTWIAFGLFICSFLFAIYDVKNTKSSSVNVVQASTNDYNPSIVNTASNRLEQKCNYCPNCGKEIVNQCVFCGNCGYKLLNKEN